jgi:hypothetical protein
MLCMCGEGLILWIWELQIRLFSFENSFDVFILGVFGRLGFMLINPFLI